MASDQQGLDQPPPRQIFVRADEVDAGTSIYSPSRELPLSALSPAEPATPGLRKAPPPRPALRRDGSGPPPPPPPPPAQPPPAPPAQMQVDPTDSLSLPQLRQLVSQFPKAEQRAYAFRYRDAEEFEREIDEWFHYTEFEQDRDYLLTSLEYFEPRWKSFCQEQAISDDLAWIAVDPAQRLLCMTSVRDGLEAKDREVRFKALCCVFYILTGAWASTSGLEDNHRTDDHSPAAGDDETRDGNRVNAAQVQWMHKGTDLVLETSLIPLLYTCLTRAVQAPDLAATQDPDAADDEDGEGAFGENEYREVSLCLSCFYLMIESARARLDTAAGQDLRVAITSLQPTFLLFLTRIISRLRWDESYNIPLMHALQLFWKSLLLFFGDVTHHLEQVKAVLQPRVDPFSADAAHPVLTASPLDYHLFRQEITSKYPAYSPPLPLIPLETEHKSILPPLPHHTKLENPPGAAGPGVSGAATRGSILHQPVHIATPAPSPPPSPVGPGGKAGKKQNYQTNQYFPFLYPPLDDSSNAIGGKGSAEMQDLMVGKKWDGSDIPRSIIEAGELFASRMRMTRSMRQLWKERDLFMKYERGWTGSLHGVSRTSPNAATADHEPGADEPLADADLQSRLQAVEDFFHSALPDLQSLVIVMMKVMLTNVQDIAVRNGGIQDTAQAGGLNRTKSNSNVTQNQGLPVPPPPPRPNEMTLEDLDNVRSREVSQKAVSGAIFVLLKWFKISHVLKFEYLTQLLLDSNYVQLTLKYFAHQNLEDLVAFNYDRDDLSMWHYCHVHSDHPPLSPTSPDERSESSSGDEAAPPPISRHRKSPTLEFPEQAAEPHPAPSGPPGHDDPVRPSVDELGNPIGPLPQTPITEYSFRQFQTSIHLLRALQKVTRGKSHRVLFLVQFKSSQILRRVLRVPEPMLRLYVLKLFKSQVPYCGRKWRQSNMRVITAIYLHCRPELRDEWLAGMHDANVEGEVDEAVPLEWALRGLTFWWQKRMYPDVMRRGKRPSPPHAPNRVSPAPGSGATPRPARSDEDVRDGIDANGVDGADGDAGADTEEVGQEIDDDERDFFQRELDAIGWGLAGLRLSDGGEDVVFGEEAAGVNGVGSYAVNGNGSAPTHADTMGGGYAGLSGTPQTPVAQPPRWVVADASSLDNWQNS